MNKRKGIRCWYFQSFFMTSIISSLLLFISTQIYLYFNDNPVFTTKTSFWLFVSSLLVTLLVGLYFALKESRILSKQLGDVLLFVSALRRGKFAERINVSNKEAVGHISDELNQLANYLQELVLSLQRLANEKATLAQTAHTAAVMEERQRLARDLHDVVSQQLFALNMMSSSAYRIFDTNPEQAKVQLNEIVSIAAKAQGEMRALLLHLRPIELSNDSLCDGIIKLIQELKGKTNLHFAASIDEISDLSSAVQEHLFRIVQEALSNILRHSHAKKVKMILEEKDRFASLHISDNGKGFDPTVERKASYGLKTMRERCDEIGGIMEIRSKIGEGTYIDIRIPIRREHND
ncbi:sensor histidine kinase [Niallia sp. 03133]|uniref:sensor histidine kinase n=1 Tax=Niallia sp. 03133 TaxID=3458060 RepID=UPI00404498E1